MTRLVHGRRRERIYIYIYSKRWRRRGGERSNASSFNLLFQYGADVIAPAMISPLQSREFPIFLETSCAPLPNLCSIAYAFLLVSSSILGSSPLSIFTDSVIHVSPSLGIHGGKKVTNNRKTNSTANKSTDLSSCSP